jgi:predicted dehydrogenase
MKLTYSHQRRFNAHFVRAKELIEAGAIGELRHFDTSCDNLYDWGTHWFDMMHYLNNESPAEWVIAQAERSNPKMIFDQPMDRCGISVVHFANGVTGTMHTGEAQHFHNRVCMEGSSGRIVINSCDVPIYEVWTASGIEIVDLNEGGKVHHKQLTAATVDAIHCLREGRESRLSSRFALAATECIFASYASAMRGGKITVPIDGELSLAEVFK